MNSSLFSELILPNGVKLPNRLAKAATEENMADDSQLPGPAIYSLYRTWAEGGAGLLITGNVMVDKRALAGPGCVVLDADTPLAPFTQWAQAARLNGAQVWMQVSHPGRQVRAAMKGEAWAPSAIALDMGKHSNRFPLPKAMSERDVEETVARFVATACAAERAGFDGVELHAAHGYLISQFLSPLSNQRVDSWGGSLKNRARFLLEIVRAIRMRVSSQFCVAVKLNSTDFQRGGFSEAESAQVILWLNELGVDLLEISGGNYESPAKGSVVEGETTAREAYFMKFATQVASVAQMPVMLTGGIGRLAIAEQALANGVSVVGMATALAIVPDLPAQWRAGNEVAATSPVVSLKDPTLARVAGLALIKRRLRAIAAGKAKPRSYFPVFTLVAEELRTYRLTRRYRRWRAKLGSERVS